jgi:endonuclease YncB( thermonuclease family)
VHGRDHPKLLQTQNYQRASLWDRVQELARETRAATVIATLLTVLSAGATAIGEERPIGRLDPGQRGSRTPQAQSLQSENAPTSKPVAEPLPQLETSSDNVASVLSLLGTSPERRQLAGELESLLRQGKLEAAEDRLFTAIEIGSLAVLLTDRLRDPKFLEELQALGSKGEERPPLPPTARDDPATLPADSAGREQARADALELAELKEAKQREQQRADAVARELATANDELHSLRALREREARSAAENVLQLTELKAAFERERERADTVARELATVREEHRALQTLREQDSALIASSRMELSELKAALERERQQDEAVVAAIPKKAEPPESGAYDRKVTRGTAGLPPISAPSSTASITRQGATSEQASLGRLRGVPEVLDTSTLSLQGRVVRLFGVEAAGDGAGADELTQYVAGREVMCEPAAPPNTYRCRVDGKDLSAVVLFNGGGRVTSDATSELKIAAQRARSAGAGIWKR